MRKPGLLFFCALLIVLLAIPMQAIAQNRRQGMRDDGAPKVGEVAPTFTLTMLNSEDEISLEGFRGKQPVVLLFGSYT